MQAKHNDSVHSVPGQEDEMGNEKDLLAGANSSIVDPMQGDSKFLVDDSLNLQNSLIHPQGSHIVGSQNDHLATSIEEESYEKVVGGSNEQLQQQNLYQSDQHAASMESNTSSPMQARNMKQVHLSNGQNVGDPTASAGSDNIKVTMSYQDEMGQQTQGKARGKRGSKFSNAPVRIPLPMSKKLIADIIYPVKTKRGIKFGKKQRNIINEEGQEGKGQKAHKLLDGFLLLFSCRVKLPHEAIRSKLASSQIADVVEDDLCYFQSLVTLDLSDNCVRMEQLRNLRYLQDLNLQFNSINNIQHLTEVEFQRLENLNLSFNKIQSSSLRNLYTCKNLQTLDLSANNLSTLPEDLVQLESLQELNLSSNLFSSVITQMNPALLFKSIGQIRRLKRLNLSRNKFITFHAELLNSREDFVQLQELDISFNLVDQERNLWFLTQTKSMNELVITGNPVACERRGNASYINLETELSKNLSAVVINDRHLAEDKIQTKKKTGKSGRLNWPYPNPIKLMSRELQKDIKGEYLNAEVMRQGIALPISDIQPDMNIESEIFPRELTQDAQAKDVFTPPDHQQMRFGDGKSSQQKRQQEEGAFFITEDIRPEFGQGEPIQEEKEYGSEIDHDQNQDDEEDEEDDIFDFGKAKMSFFKQRARQILLGPSQEETEEKAYEGNPLPLNVVYSSIKNLIKRPTVTYNHSTSDQPHYMKMTFAMSRSVVPHAKVLQLSSMLANVKKIGKEADKPLAITNQHASNSELTLLRQMKRDGAGTFMGPDKQPKKKTKKEELIDQKIEQLLVAYQKKDEETLRKASQLERDKVEGKQNLMEKFGFSDDEGENLTQ